MAAFVLHEHSGYGPVHYDLMLSHGEALATWRVEAPPAALAEACLPACGKEAGPAGKQVRELPARRLPDHRAAYLSYEGLVSDGRGQVKMLDAGGYELLSESPLRWEIVLHGRLLAGRWELVRDDQGADRWTLRRLSPAGP